MLQHSTSSSRTGGGGGGGGGAYFSPAHPVPAAGLVTPPRGSRGQQRCHGNTPALLRMTPREHPLLAVHAESSPGRPGSAHRAYSSAAFGSGRRSQSKLMAFTTPTTWRGHGSQSPPHRRCPFCNTIGTHEHNGCAIVNRDTSPRVSAEIGLGQASGTGYRTGTVPSAGLDNLLRECRDLRSAVLTNEVERLKLPSEAEVVAALEALEVLGNSADRAIAAAQSSALESSSVSSPSSSTPLVSTSATRGRTKLPEALDEAVQMLPAAQRIIDQFGADASVAAHAGGAPLSNLLHDVQVTLDGLMETAGLGW
eukprot:INCI19599.1.p1 GENE.INCI19599.1~~INCI19599.1.p1  ORF type:complete len:310 (-),score=39.99 INCI19599.1:65-994(-)